MIRFSVLLFVLLVPLLLQALPSTDLAVPQTQVLQKGVWRSDFQGQLSPTKREDLTPISTSKSTFGLSYGIFTKSIYAAEIGLDWREPQGDSISSAIQMNFKVRMFDLKDKGWSIAVGAHDFGFDADVNAYNILYGVFQQTLVNTYDIILGAYTGSSDLLVDSDNEVSKQGFLLGGSKMIQNGEGKFVVQFVGGSNQFSFLYTGFNVLISDGLKAVLAYAHAVDSGYRSWVLFKTQIYY